MVEEQAAARVDRIGQTKPVTIYRYLVENSIETVSDKPFHFGSVQTLKYGSQQMIRARQRKKLWIAKLSISQKHATAETEMSENLMVTNPCIVLFSAIPSLPSAGSERNVVTSGIADGMPS